MCMFPPDWIWARRLSNFTVHIMIAYLVLGLFFLLVDNRRLMFASMAYCGLLSLFLKASVNQDIRLPVTSGAPRVSVMHVNLSTLKMDYQRLGDHIENSGVDVVSFNEITPDSDFLLERELGQHFPHSAKIVRIDRYGLAIYSRVAIANIDTIHIYGGERPHLEVGINFGLGNELHVIDSYFLPPLTRRAYGNYRVELTQLGQRIRNMTGPVIACGDYNLSDWSSEMREYKELSGLISSRRDISPGPNTGVKSLLNVPNDHILFNDQLECIEFRTLNDSTGQHIGIMGIYQLKNDKSATLK